MSESQEVKGHTQHSLTVSTTVDGSSVLPPPDPLSRHTPLSGRNTAGTTQLQGWEGGVVIMQAGMHTHTITPSQPHTHTHTHTITPSQPHTYHHTLTHTHTHHHTLTASHTHLEAEFSAVVMVC